MEILCRFLAISAEIVYNTSKAGSISVLVVFLGGSSYLMTMLIATILISGDSLIPLAPCSPISVVRLQSAAWADA